MAALELSTAAEVAHYLGLDPLEPDDEQDVIDALSVGREQITQMVLPEARLPDPLPRSLHRACTIRAAQDFANRNARYGYQPPEDGAPGPTPPRFLIADLIGPWARPKGGVGPDPSAQVWD